MGHYIVPPFPSDPQEVERWETTRQRRRLLSGCWEEDVQRRVLSHFGTVRSAVIGKACKALNLFDRVCSALASCYDETPKVWHREGNGDVPGLLGQDGLIAGTGIWELLRDVQRYTIGCREELLRVDWNARDGLHVRRIHADTVLAQAWTSCPDRPHTLYELRWFEQEQDYFWEVLSVADPANPVYAIHRMKGGGAPRTMHDQLHRAVQGAGGIDPMGLLGPDYTRELLGQDYSGAAYPFRWTQGARRGQPFLPVGTYHAQRTGRLWNHREQQEAVEATLDLATAWTFFMHALFRASWPQRYVGNGMVGGVAGATPASEQGGAAVTREVVTDPTSLLELFAKNPQHPILVGQWGPGANLLEMADAIGRFESAVSQFDGLDAGHVVRRTSNDAESAASLSIKREGRRQAQRVYEPQQRRVDLELVERLAALSNLAGLTPQVVPETGYRLRYVALPLSPEELRARREHNNELIDQGRLSIIDALMDENPGITREEAIALKARIDDENTRYSRPVDDPAQAA